MATTELQAAAAEIAERENELLKLLEAERAKVNKLREALGFYSTGKHYRDFRNDDNADEVLYIACEYGSVAAKALAETAGE